MENLAKDYLRCKLGLVRLELIMLGNPSEIKSPENNLRQEERTSYMNRMNEIYLKIFILTSDSKKIKFQEALIFQIENNLNKDLLNLQNKFDS